ncbi:MAG: hypothetical protein WCF24_03320, partial [Acidimicrobiales bacterium]
MKFRRGKQGAKAENEREQERASVPSASGTAETTLDEFGATPSTASLSSHGESQSTRASGVATLTLNDSVEKTTVRIGELLLERGLANEAQIDQALARQREHGGRLGEILVDMGVVRERALAEVLAWKFDM